MTQKALAEKVGVTRQTIIAIEKAKYSPSLELAVLIARALGRTLDEVFIDEGDQDMYEAMCAYRDAGFNGPFMMDGAWDHDNPTCSGKLTN